MDNHSGLPRTDPWKAELMIGSNSVVQRSNSRVNSRFPGSSKTTKHIFVTGGVASSLGKGLTASSLGHLLRARGLSVTMQKLDPYLNVDPGTMNPFQHGEVFVTDDGAETDLDIGHYERFLDENLEGSANVTTGQVYSTVIAKERRGEYLGDTVQVIPHITDEIKRRMRLPAEGKHAPDVIITEIGGTVGDIESQPFLESARQVRQDIGRGNVFFLHVSLVPYIGPSQELKTKPTQHSVAALRSIGIQPEAIVIRSDREVPQAMRDKIGRMCDVDIDAVIGCPDAPSIYDIPKTLHSQGLDSYIVRALDLPFKDVDWTSWDRLLDAVHNPKHEVEIALVGKYIDLPDAYLSVTEALRAGGFANDTKVKIRWVPSDECETHEGAVKSLDGVDAICVPGGFGIRGLEGKLGALKYARESKLPVLGLCLGLQCMVIEYARNVVGLEGASSSEFEPDSKYPVIATMEEQLDIVDGKGDLGGTMRLGLYEAKLDEGLRGRRDLRHHQGQRTAPPPLRGQQQVPRADRRPGTGVLRNVARRQARGVRGTSPRSPPVLRGHAGAPGAQLTPDPAARAVLGTGEGRPGAPEGQRQQGRQGRDSQGRRSRRPRRCRGQAVPGSVEVTPN